jgi:hypothetical protein
MSDQRTYVRTVNLYTAREPPGDGWVEVETTMLSPGLRHLLRAKDTELAEANKRIDNWHNRAFAAETERDALRAALVEAEQLIRCANDEPEMMPEREWIRRSSEFMKQHEALRGTERTADQPSAAPK